MTEGRTSFAAKAAAGEAMLGILQTHPNASFGELAAMCGYDFLILDCEHGLFSDSDLLNALQASEASKAVRMVRLKGHDLSAVGRVMDMGADALLVPNVADAAEAQALVRAMRYPPVGSRGYGASAHRVSRYGLDVIAHRSSPIGAVLLFVMIESRRGVEEIEAILAIQGIDGVFIGPSDLSASIGCPGEFDSSAYKTALVEIEDAARKAGKLLGCAAHPGNGLGDLAQRGHTLLLAGYDMPLIRDAMLQQLKQAHTALGRAT